MIMKLWPCKKLILGTYNGAEKKQPKEQPFGPFFKKTQKKQHTFSLKFLWIQNKEFPFKPVYYFVTTTSGDVLLYNV